MPEVVLRKMLHGRMEKVQLLPDLFSTLLQQLLRCQHSVVIIALIIVQVAHIIVEFVHLGGGVVGDTAAYRILDASEHALGVVFRHEERIGGVIKIRHRHDRGCQWVRPIQSR